MKTRKVITSARLRTSESPALLNVDARNRAVIVGRRPHDDAIAVGLIGKVAEQGTASSVLDFGVWMDLSFPHVVGIFGTRGSGKSFDLGVIAECVAREPQVINGNPPTAAIILFDVQDQFWTLGRAPDANLSEDTNQRDQLGSWGLEGAEIADLVVWRPSGYQTPLANTVEFSLSPDQLGPDDWLALLELDRYSPMGQALLALLADFGSSVPGLLAQRCIPNQTLASFQQATIDGLRWRLAALEDAAVISQQGIQVSDLLRRGRTSIILLRQLSDSLRGLIVGVLARMCADRMGTYHQARRVARRTGTALPADQLPDRLWMIIDEAHVIAPAAAPSAATGPIVDYVKRGRDAGLSMIFATQQPSAVDTRLMSQVDLTLTHALGFESDLLAAIARMPTRSTLAYELGSWKLTSMNDILRSLDPGECVIADAANGRAFVARIRPRLTAHGGNTPV